MLVTLTISISLLGVSFTGSFKSIERCEAARTSIISAIENSDAAGKISVGECKKKSK